MSALQKLFDVNAGVINWIGESHKKGEVAAEDRTRVIKEQKTDVAALVVTAASLPAEFAQLLKAAAMAPAALAATGVEKAATEVARKTGRRLDTSKVKF